MNISSEKHKLLRLTQEEINNLNKPISIKLNFNHSKDTIQITAGFTSKLYRGSKKEIAPILYNFFFFSENRTKGNYTQLTLLGLNSETRHRYFLKTTG